VTLSSGIVSPESTNARGHERNPEAPVEHAAEPLLPMPFPLEARTLTGKRVCVVIPAYNEEAVLPRTHAALADVLNRSGVSWSIVFINDGSRDRSAGVLEALHRSDPHVGYILLSRNFGHQAALTAGLDHADGDVIVTMDADLQHPPEMIPRLLAAWAEGYDVVHTRKLTTEGLSRWRDVLTRLAYRLISRISEVEIIPHASDYRVLDAEALDAVRRLPEHARLYRGLTPWVGFRQCVVPYVAAPRAAGTSQYGLKQLVSLFARAFFDFSRLPLHLGLWLGAGALALSVLYLLFILAWLLLGESTPPGWASSISVTLLLSSVSLVFSGIIGVYVARIYDEVRARPSYVMSRFRPPEPDSTGE